MAQGPERVVFPTTRIHQGADARRRLRELGLQERPFMEAMVYGDGKRKVCSPLHPKSFPGQTMWAETTLSLRGNCMAIGPEWKPNSLENYETVANEKLGFTISVVGGDVNTGVVAFAHPKAARVRGPVTTRRIAVNRSQMLLDLPGIPKSVDDPSAWENWFFLINARRGGLFAELSLPVGIALGARVNLWSERIILPSYEVEDAVTPLAPEDTPSEAPVIRINRRS